MQSSKYQKLATRVGYLDYCGEEGNGYRINIPMNVYFDNSTYGGAIITDFIPSDYQIDPDFPTILCTLSTTSIDINLQSAYLWIGTKNGIYIQISKIYTGTLLFSVGVRLRRSDLC